MSLRINQELVIQFRRFCNERLGLAIAGLLLASGCASLPAPPPAAPKPVPPVTLQIPIPPPSAIVSSETQTLTPDELRQVTDTRAEPSYLLGPDDVISVSIYLHPELSVPQPGLNSGLSGALIGGDGTVSLPLVGAVKLAGLSIEQAQQALAAAYQPYVRDPNINIQLIQPQSMRYYLLGAFAAPGIKYPLHQLTLLEALALGGSVDIPAADLYQAYVAQGSTKLPVDLHALLIDGDLTQNIPLASGDTIVVPTSATENAFVFGAVGKPGAIPFQSGALSLLQALSEAGLDLPNYTQSRLSQVRVIRAEGRSAEFYVVDATMILSAKAASFNLQPGDIVFVPPTTVATWNQALAQILPSLQTVSGALNPFVSIKYLTH
jgi:polysaccharide export outer membrane protein